MTKPTNTGVVVAHPGMQHSYETALGVQEAGLLRRYVTGFYYDPQMPLGRLVGSLPGSARERLEGLLSRRRKRGLDPSLVRTIAFWDLVRMLVTTGGKLPSWAMPILATAGRRFDRLLPRILAELRPAAVLAYDTAALGAFHAAKAIGIRCILDQTIAHSRVGHRLIEEERELHPEVADSLMLESDPRPRLERGDHELVLADRILAGSEYVRSTLVAEGVDREKIVVNPYGADLERFRPIPREDSVFRVLFVGQFTQRKGLTYLFDAFRRLRLPNAEIVVVGKIVGSGRGFLAYRDVFRHLGGIPHGEIHRCFQQADVFVYPSLHEGSALAIYESLACGVPVITTPNSGSIVEDGIDGFLVPIRDADAIAARIELLYREPELRLEMGRAARRHVERFAWADYRRRLGQALHRWLADWTDGADAEEQRAVC